MDHPSAKGYQVSQTADAMELPKQLGDLAVLLAVLLSVVFQRIALEHDTGGFGLEIQKVQESGEKGNGERNFGGFAENVWHGSEGEDLR